MLQRTHVGIATCFTLRQPRNAFYSKDRYYDVECTCKFYFQSPIHVPKMRTSGKWFGLYGNMHLALDLPVKDIRPGFFTQRTTRETQVLFSTQRHPDSAYALRCNLHFC